MAGGSGARHGDARLSSTGIAAAFASSPIRGKTLSARSAARASPGRRRRPRTRRRRLSPRPRRAPSRSSRSTAAESRRLAAHCLAPRQPASAAASRRRATAHPRRSCHRRDGDGARRPDHSLWKRPSTRRSAPMPAPSPSCATNDQESPLPQCRRELQRWPLQTVGLALARFPIGAFSFSHGLEASGGERRRPRPVLAATLDPCDRGVGRRAHRCGYPARRASGSRRRSDIEALIVANRRGVAFRATAETRLETTRAGRGVPRYLPRRLARPFLDRWAAGAREAAARCAMPPRSAPPRRGPGSLSTGR